jgi:DNA-binding SARP family transcriptional activator/tetratricopeptide (TPR) repeat protein
VTDARLIVRLLGPPEIMVDREPLRVDTRKAVAILAYLVATEQPQARDHLAALLWPEADDASARGALRRTLSTLKAALGGRWLVVDRSSARLERRDAWADVWSLRDGAADAPMLRGEFMAGFSLRDAPDFDDWVAVQAEACRQQAITVLDGAARAAAGEGSLAEAILLAERRLAMDHLDEGGHRQLMELHATAGDRSSAVRQYRSLVRRLAQELDVEPLPETTALYESILAGEGPAGVPARRSSRGPRQVLPLVGRDADLARLTDAWRLRAVRLALVEGEPGIGKTRLGEELQRRVAEDGSRWLGIRGYADQRETPYAALVEVLERVGAEEPARLAGLAAPERREVARLVPRLAGAEGRPEADAGPGGRARLVRSLARALAVAAGDLLLVDDAQAVDHATLAVIGQLVRGEAGGPLVVVMRRPVDPATDPLLNVVADTRRDGRLLDLHLARLGPAAVRELVARSGAAADPDRLYAESDGVPFYLAERLAALEAGGDPGAVPPGVRDLVRTRVTSCGELARQLAAAAAVIGAGFGLNLARAVSGRSSDEVAGAVDELLAMGLLVARDDGRLELDHELTRTVLLEDLSLGRRRALHRRAALALRRSRAGRAAPARVAQHLRAAGDGDDAAEWYRRAGERAGEVYAHEEAIDHYRTALALAPELGRVLHERIGDHLMRLGRYAAAAAAYEGAAGEAPPADAWRAELGLARAHRRLGNLQLAEAHAEAAELSLSGDRAADEARVHLERARIADRLGRSEEATEHADRAMRLLGDEPSLPLAEARNLSGLLARHRGEEELAREHLTEALRLASATGSPSARMASLNNLALLEAAGGEHGAAEARLRQALGIAVGIGDRHHEAALRSNLADTLHAAGRRPEAVEEVGRSAAIMAELGGIGLEASEPSAEVWRLTDW